MKDTEILKRVIKKAVKNGYKLPEAYEAIFYELDIGYDRMDELWWRSKGYYGLIFSHDFAKAFWGEDVWVIEHNKRKPMVPGMETKDISVYKAENDPGKPKYSWQRHTKHPRTWEIMLKEMAGEEDPLKYLESFLISQK